MKLKRTMARPGEAQGDTHRDSLARRSPNHETLLASFATTSQGYFSFQERYLKEESRHVLALEL